MLVARTIRGRNPYPQCNSRLPACTGGGSRWQACGLSSPDFHFVFPSSYSDNLAWCGTSMESGAQLSGLCGYRDSASVCRERERGKQGEEEVDRSSALLYLIIIHVYTAYSHLWRGRGMMMIDFMTRRWYLCDIVIVIIKVAIIAFVIIP